MRINQSRRIPLVLAALVVAASPSAMGQSDEQRIQYRQALMSSMGGNMAAISLIVKGRLMHRENLAEHARQIAGAGGLVKSAFGERLARGRTDALEKIWVDWAGFLEIAEEMTAEGDRLVTVAEGGDLKSIAVQVKSLGKTCGKCHKQFRKPKEESYKKGN